MKPKSIQSNLFFTYSLIIIAVLLVFVVFFYVWVSNVLKTRAFESIDNLSDSFQEKLDYEIQKMDAVSMNILYSNLVKKRFEKYLAYNSMNVSEDSSQEKDKLEAIDNAKELVDMLTAIIGPSRPVQQIYLYDFNGKMFGTGFDNRQLNMSVKDKEWYQEVIDKQGHKVITLPEKGPELSKSVSLQRDNYYISLCRIYFDKYNVPQGIVEVKQYYDIIINNIAEYMNKNPNHESVFVYDSSGRLVYPVGDTSGKESAYYYQYYNQTRTGENYHIAENPATKKRELLVYKYSDYTGWIITVAVSEDKLLSPVYTFTKIVVIVAVAILFLALLFSFIAARKYTTPIAKLRKMIRSMDWQEPVSTVPQELNSGLNELEELNQAFHKMNIKVKKSVEDLLLSQQQEMQSKMLALQSQMNPHFLYNTLATVSAMAEENMDEQIVEMCGYVSDMLRYISSDRSPSVSIATEIEYTEKYLACMKFRYGNKLSYSIEIDDRMREIQIPKLVIQPLVENALKYGTHREPPWNVRIFGYVSSGFWQLTVQDNGCGFDQETLGDLNEKIREIDQKGLLPSLELEGMGLLNIYIRMKLTYKNQMIFSIADHPQGGAAITIGGSLAKYSGRE